MIPKVIHYCWFGKKRIPPELEKNIESWKKFLPDYRIIRWDESNFDIHCNKYVTDAYRAKKYAFVSDFARFLILEKNGGVYFDTDVEVLRPMDDILAAGPYMGEERQGRVSAGVGMAMEPGMPFLREMIELYNKLEFSISDEAEKTVTIVDHVTRLLIKHGFDPKGKGIRSVCGINIYPTDYFCPQEFFSGIITITDNTRTIHHFAESWKPPLERHLHRLLITMNRKYERNCFISFLDSILYYYRRMIEKGFSSSIKTFFRKIFRIHKQSS